MNWRFQLVTKPYGGVTEGPVWDGGAIYAQEANSREQGG